MGPISSGRLPFFSSGHHSGYGFGGRHFSSTLEVSTPAVLHPASLGSYSSLSETFKITLPSTRPRSSLVGESSLWVPVVSRCLQLPLGFVRIITSELLANLQHAIFIMPCHSVFERHHRFAGWSAVAMVWIFVCLTDSLNTDGGFTGSGRRLSHAQEFWYALFITIL